MSCNNTESCRGCHPMFSSTLRELRPDQRFCSTHQVQCSELPTCSGCLNDQPNQLAHMDPGGCLYEDEVASINLRGIPYVEELFIESIATEIRADQNFALERASRQLLLVDSGDAEKPEKKKPKVDVSKSLVSPLFALPCGFNFAECAICYEPIEMVNVAVTTCGHAFHASCAFRALDRTDCCPMCRHRLVDDGCEDEEQSEAESENDEDDEGESEEGEGEHEEEEDEQKISLEQLTAKLVNMGYTMADIMKSLLPSLKSETNEARYTEEFGNKLHYDIHEVMEGIITLAHRDTRSYAVVAGASRISSLL